DAARLEQRGDRRGGDALAERGHHATGDEYEFGHEGPPVKRDYTGEPAPPGSAPAAACQGSRTTIEVPPSSPRSTWDSPPSAAIRACADANQAGTAALPLATPGPAPSCSICSTSRTSLREAASTMPAAAPAPSARSKTAAAACSAAGSLAGRARPKPASSG